MGSTPRFEVGSDTKAAQTTGQPAEPLILALADDRPRAYSGGRTGPGPTTDTTPKPARDTAPRAAAPHAAEAIAISADILNASSFQPRARDFEHLLQTVAKENPASGVRNTIAQISTELGRNAAAGDPRLRLEASNNGNNWHFNLIDTTVRYKPDANPDPRLTRGGAGAGYARRDFLNGAAEAYRRAAYKDDLDVNVALEPAKSDAIEDAAARAADQIKQQAIKFQQWSTTQRGPEPLLIDQSFMTPFIDTAVKNRPATDASGAETIQTAIIDLNRSLRETGLNVSIAKPNSASLSADLKDFCRQNPQAIAMQITQRGPDGVDRTAGEYAYDPAPLLAQASDRRTPLEAITDRVRTSGKFTDPNGGIARMVEYKQAVSFFQGQNNIPDAVDKINRDLGPGAPYHLVVGRVGPNNPLQITILDAQNKQRDVLQVNGR